MCDQISDAVLDAHLKSDPDSKVACETVTKTGKKINFFSCLFTFLLIFNMLGIDHFVLFTLFFFHINRNDYDLW